MIASATVTFCTPQAILRAALTILQPPPDVTGSEWTGEYRMLSQEDSGAAGRWDLAARPYQNEIMDVAADYIHEFVTILGPSQWGKTAVMGNSIGRIIHLDPGPIMVVHNTIHAAQKWSKTRFAVMVRDCPVLHDLVAPSKSRDSGNTILEKSFRGGLIINVGANAPAGLASQPIRYLFFEEIDRVPKDQSAGKEGDYEDLAIARTTDENFIRVRKIYRSSSPTIQGASRSERAWNVSDQRYWHFRCPHCGHEQRTFWENVVFEETNVEAATYACSAAGCEITEAEFRRAIRSGCWIATRPEVKNHAGFWIHGLMVRSMAYIVAEFIKARKGGIQTLITWKNTCLGELWNLRDGDAEQVEGLQERARSSNYMAGEVPDGVGLLVAAIDVQDDRLELLIMGVGVGEETWRIVRIVIPGNLATKEPWDRAEAFLNQDWPRLSGGALRVRAAAVDIGGHFSKHVYAFCRRPGLRGRAFAVKGATTSQAKLVRRSGSKARLWLVDTVTAKDQILGCLKIGTPGAGFANFPQDMDGDYFEQLLAERPIHKAGRRGYEKVTPDARNEALDLEVYCAAALAIYAPRDLEALVSRTQVLKDEAPKQEAPAEAPPAQEDVVAPAKSPTRAMRRIPRKGGLLGW